MDQLRRLVQIERAALLPGRDIVRLFLPSLDIGRHILGGWLPMSDRCLRRCRPDWVSLRPSRAGSEGDYRYADTRRPHADAGRVAPITPDPAGGVADPDQAKRNVRAVGPTFIPTR